MARRALARRIKVHDVYTVTEAAIALGRAARTIRGWITREGLPAATDMRPWLISA